MFLGPEEFVMKCQLISRPLVALVPSQTKKFRIFCEKDGRVISEYFTDRRSCFVAGLKFLESGYINLRVINL